MSKQDLKATIRKIFVESDGIKIKISNGMSCKSYSREISDFESSLVIHVKKHRHEDYAVRVSTGNYYNCLREHLSKNDISYKTTSDKQPPLTIEARTLTVPKGNWYNGLGYLEMP